MRVATVHNRIDTKSFGILRSLAVATLLLAPASAFAKPLTVNDITVEVPSGFKASESDRGIEMKTPDEEVFVWVETYTPASEAAIMGEHEAYWKEQGVKLAGAEKSTNDKKSPPTHATDYKGATWKGDPTVLRYFHVGPFGKSDKSILVTLWASPAGNDQHVADLQTIYDSINVKE